MPHPTPFPMFKLEPGCGRWRELICQPEGQHLSREAPGARSCSWPFLEEPGRARCGAGALLRLREGPSGPHSLLILTSSLEKGPEKYGLDLLVFSF